MLFFSDRFWAATSEAQQAIFLAAGEAKLALVNGTTQQAHYLLGSLALLLVSIVMLCGKVFSKLRSYLGIIANLLVFRLYVPTIGIFLSILSVFPLLKMWLILVGRWFLQLGFRKRGQASNDQEYTVVQFQTG